MYEELRFSFDPRRLIVIGSGVVLARIEEQGGARRGQEKPRGARRGQEEPGGARRGQEGPGGARRSEEETGGARMGQEEPGVARRSQEAYFWQFLAVFLWFPMVRW